MPESVAAFWQLLVNLEIPTGWVALIDALIGATVGYVTREIEEYRRRRRERRGLLRLLETETTYNANLLDDYETNPAQIADRYRRSLSTRAWDKASTRIASTRLAQLLKDDTLLADLSEYYEEIRAIVLYARDPAVTVPKCWLPDSLTLYRKLRTLPAVAAEVPLEGSKLRVLPPQGIYIRLVTHVVEPPVHDGILFTHLLLKLVPGHLVVVDLPPYNATEGLSYLGHSLFVSGNVYLSPDPRVRILKGYGGEGSNVLDGHMLERLVRVQRLSQGTPEDLLTHHLPVLHEEDRTEDRVRKIERAQMLLDFPLAVEVRDPSLSMSAADRAIDTMLHTGLYDRISNRLAL